MLLSMIVPTMRTFLAVNYYRKLFKNLQIRWFSKHDAAELHTIDSIRNIGVLAHIDAGKTTTTERMLFYSGTIRSMGEVHHGNTVTDYMDQERQRGITITAASVSFPWHGNQINLIDTPGHIDFTMEVEQSLAVLDGAVVVMDASAGVEAQTITVWRQADGYKVPRIVYLNKMDRADADENMCIKSIQDKLQVPPLLLHRPVVYQDKLIGLIDLVTLEEIIWTQGRGFNFERRKLTEKEDGKIWAQSMESHRQIIDTLSSQDDQLAEIIIENESLDKVTDKQIKEAIRRSTLNMKLFPVLCGSSYKNIGVQTLMDSVIDFLPTPRQCNELYKIFGTDLAARAFKVIHDDQRGVLTFLRVYSGELNNKQRIYNLALNKSEQMGSLYVALADDYNPVEKVTAGNIAVVSSLQATMSGHLITSTHAAASKAKSRLSGILKTEGVDRLLLPSGKQRLLALDTKPTDDEIADIMLGIGTTIPDPVFVCSIEPPSLAYQTPLETALAELQREDPSLRVTTDDETGQMLIAGMGELHLEIIKERIIREYKIQVETGPLQIAYKEALIGTSKQSTKVDRKIGNIKQMVNITMSAKHVKGLPQDKILKFDQSAESAANLSHLYPKYLNAIQQGVESALLHGPKLGCPVIDVQATLHWFEVGRGTSESVVTATTAQCLRKVFEEAETVLLEPIMSLEVVCPESHSSRVLADISRRRADIQHIHLRHHNKVIDFLAPLSELLGYSTTLRSLSSGLATFTMEFHSHRMMSPYDEEQAIKRVTGF